MADRRQVTSLSSVDSWIKGAEETISQLEEDELQSYFRQERQLEKWKPTFDQLDWNWKDGNIKPLDPQ